MSLIEPSEGGALLFRYGTADDVEVCLALWVAACAARDGEAISGVVERALPIGRRVRARNDVAMRIAGPS